MKEIYLACELTDKEKLLLFFLLNPTLKHHLKERGVFVKDAFTIVSALGEERLEQIVTDLNETVYDTEFIKELARRTDELQNK